MNNFFMEIKEKASSANKKKKLIIAIIGIVLVLAICAGGIAVMQFWKKPEEPKTSSKPVTPIIEGEVQKIPVTTVELSMRFPDFKTKALTLSYDEGTDFDQTLLSIINFAGIKATFNINSNRFNFMDDAQKQTYVERYSGGGHEIAGHTVKNYALQNLSEAEAINEIISDRVSLENGFDTIVKGFAYPKGTVVTDALKDKVSLCGIKYARTEEATYGFDLPSDWLAIKPTCNQLDAQINKLADSFLADDGQIKLFNVWGRAREIAETNGGWDKLTSFCQKVGNRVDVWYATSGEIYSYVNAYQGLEKSADGTTIFNPSQTAVYVNVGGTDVVIESGKTIKLSN